MNGGLPKMIGFPRQFILNDRNISAYDFCPACHLLVCPNEAILLQCGHLYCTPCYSTNKNAGVCLADVCLADHTAMSRELCKTKIEFRRNNIWKMAVKCEFENDGSGCTWEGLLREYTWHRDKCLFRPQPQQMQGQPHLQPQAQAHPLRILYKAPTPIAQRPLAPSKRPPSPPTERYRFPARGRGRGNHRGGRFHTAPRGQGRANHVDGRFHTAPRSPPRSPRGRSPVGHRSPVRRPLRFRSRSPLRRSRSRSWSPSRYPVQRTPLSQSHSHSRYPVRRTSHSRSRSRTVSPRRTVDARATKKR